MKRLLSIAVASSIAFTSSAFAAVSDEEFALLREQLAAVSARLDQLEAENAELKAEQKQTDAGVETAVAAMPASSSSWTDRVSLDGDFRYRYERIDAEGSDTRKRNRIRARANIKAQLDDRTEVGFGLATGGDDPVSTNQTLGGGGSTKGVGLNLAYVDWEATDGLNLMAGKFKNPLLRVGGQQLTWDSDWTPEGLAVKYEHDWFFVNAIGTFLEGDSGRANSNFSWGGQVGASAVVGDVNLTGGIGYFAIPTKGEATTFGDPSDPGDFYGNTAVQADGQACGTTPGESCVYLYDYNLAQAFGVASFDVGELPASVFFEYVLNSDASDNDTGWALGGTIGQAKNRGEMEFTYYYADKQADSMLGLLTDSDFGGGGADSKGHRLHFTYGMSKTWAIGAQYFINEVDVASGSKSDYDRLMFDFQWKWK
jgi:hypothetical protein